MTQSGRGFTPDHATALPIPTWVAALPKADLHVHAEADAGIDRVLARREGRRSYDWRTWAACLRAETPPGMPRLAHLSSDRLHTQAKVDAFDAVPENFIARVEDLLAEGAADGAIFIEVRFGRLTLAQPEFMTLFREAERRVQQRYPRLRAEAVISGLWPPLHDPDGTFLHACLASRRHGLAGIDLIPAPYNREADWRLVGPWVAQAADAGLGVTAHAAEFSAANLAAALRLPGLRRIGHAVYAARDERLLEIMVSRGVTVECPLTCNVVLGAVPFCEVHPIRQFVAAGIPVALATDDPVRVCTTIGYEYAVAATLGLSSDDLVAFTRNAVEAALIPLERRAGLISELRGLTPKGRTQ